MNTRKVAGIGMMIALAFILSYVESLVPIPLGIPGVKLGLSNIVVMFALYWFSTGTAFFIAIVRILLVGLTFGNLAGMLYSMAGGLLSFVGMVLLKKTDWFSVYGVSLAGGVLHNIGQLLVAVLVLQTSLLAYYLPVLMISGLLAGLAVGFVSAVLIERLQAAGIEKT